MWHLHASKSCTLKKLEVYCYVYYVEFATSDTYRCFMDVHFFAVVHFHSWSEQKKSTRIATAFLKVRMWSEKCFVPIISMLSPCMPTDGLAVLVHSHAQIHTFRSYTQPLLAKCLRLYCANMHAFPVLSLLARQFWHSLTPPINECMYAQLIASDYYRDVPAIFW